MKIVAIFFDLEMYPEKTPIVLVHGLCNSSKIFKSLIKSLDEFNVSVFSPNLYHDHGRIPLIDLSQQLDIHIKTKFGKNRPIDLLGFSMGGIVSRIWLQKIDKGFQTRKFISVGSPHKGTYLAEFVPRLFFEGIADMKRRSILLRDLNSDISILSKIDCVSFYCSWDLMVVPGWEAVLPVGLKFALPVYTHRSLILSPIAIKYLRKVIVCSNIKDLNA